MLNLNYFIIFDTEEIMVINDFKTVKLLKKKITFMLVFWVNVCLGQCFPVTVF